MKTCARCKKKKPTTDFCIDRHRKDGLNPYCRDCSSTWNQNWVNKHQDEYKALRQNWQNIHRKELNMRHLNWVNNHREEHRAYMRKNSRDRYATDLEFRAKADQENRNRVALKRGATGKGVVTIQEWENLKDLYNYKCLCCGKKETPLRKLSQDHIIPVCKGGLNVINNIQPLCRSCNSSKGTKDTDYR